MLKSKCSLGKFFLFLMFIPSVGAVIFSEVMYNPAECADTECEWVELYNEGSADVDLALCTLDGEPLSGILQPGYYLILVRSEPAFRTRFSQDAVIFPISFSLRNSGDTITLQGTAECTDKFNYTELVGLANGNDKTLELIDGDWRESISVGGSPGRKNNDADRTSAETIPPSCDWQIFIAANETIAEEAINFSVEIRAEDSYEVTVRGVVEDSGGTVVKSYSPWTVDRLENAIKNYHPSLPEGEYTIRFWVENSSCLDVDEGNNEAVAAIKVISSVPPTFSLPSSLAINKLYLGNDNAVSWGEQFSVKVTIYKGDESKETVSLWVEKDGVKKSIVTKANLPEKNREYSLTLPVQIFSDCDSDVMYTLVLEAFDVREERELTINSGACSGNKTKDPKRQSIKSFELVNLSSSLVAGETLLVPIHFQNSEQQHSFRVWTYLYKGSVCYSCNNKTEERDAHAQEFILQAGESVTREFMLQSDNKIDDGVYKLKIKVKIGDLKTEKELTKEITILPYVEQGQEIPLSMVATVSAEEAITISAGERELNPSVPEAITGKNSITGAVVYESSSAKIKKFLPFTIIGILILLVTLTIGKKAPRKT